MNNDKIVRELVAVAQELVDYNKSTVSLGKLVKKTFRGYPWKYDKRAKAWVLTGERKIEEFYEEFEFDEIMKKLSKKFEGYLIVFDAQDSYLLITLD